MYLCNNKCIKEASSSAKRQSLKICRSLQHYVLYSSTRNEQTFLLPSQVPWWIIAKVLAQTPNKNSAEFSWWFLLPCLDKSCKTMGFESVVNWFLLSFYAMPPSFFLWHIFLQIFALKNTKEIKKWTDVFFIIHCFKQQCCKIHCTSRPREYFECYVQYCNDLVDFETFIIMPRCTQYHRAYLNIV